MKNSDPEGRGINPEIGKLIPTQRVGVLTNLRINSKLQPKLVTF